jgi:hypothetical protein
MKAPGPRQDRSQALGHRSMTVRYTALVPDRFKGFWKD